MVLYKDQDKPELSLRFKFISTGEIRFEFYFHVLPFNFYRDEARGQERIRRMLSFVREMASRFPSAYAYGHSNMDASLGSDPHQHYKHNPPRQVYEVYWLNVYGKAMVEAIGRERVLSTPAVHLEELPHGGVLFLTRPTPGDFASDEARIAQARALAHLKPEFSFDTVLAQLRQRSAHLAPVERNWDPDLEALLEYTLELQVALKDRQRETARLNAWRPPPVSEWVPLEEAPPTDTRGGGRSVLAFISLHAEGMVIMLEDKVPEVKGEDPASLIPLDQHFWTFNIPRFEEPEDIEKKFIPVVGSYLGEMMVNHLGGRWVVRHKLEECYVALGDRAWLPFLRARHYFQSKQSALDYSMTKFYREAERHVRGRSSQA